MENYCFDDSGFHRCVTAFTRGASTFFVLFNFSFYTFRLHTVPSVLSKIFIGCIGEFTGDCHGNVIAINWSQIRTFALKLIEEIWLI